MNIFDVWNHAPMLHAAVVHLPIVLALVGFVFVLACGMLDENRTLRIVTVIIFAALLITAQYAIDSGEFSRARVPNTLDAAAWNLLDQHELMAGRVRIAALVTLVFSLLILVRHPQFQKAMLLITGLSSFATVLLVSTTAHFGGTLVYTHALGTDLLIQHEHDRAGNPLAAYEAAAAAEELVPVSDIDPEAAKAVDYERDVRPIVTEHCLECHSAPEPDGGFDISTIENMMKAGEKGGPGVIPGDPDKSAIIKYIRGESRPRMPHKKPALAPELLHTLRMWIQAGALPAPGATPVAAPAAAPVPEAAPAPAAPFNPFG